MEIFEKILNEFHIDHAYEHWREYRQNLTEEILCLAEQTRTIKQDAGDVSPVRIRIAGIGSGNDIDLRKLLKMGYRLELLDMDPEALRMAKERYEIREEDPVTVRIHTLTGLRLQNIEQFFYRMYLFLLKEQNAMTEERFFEKALQEQELLFRLIRNHAKDHADVLSPESCDMMVAVGLFSQLFTVWSYAYQVLLSNASEIFFHGRMPEEDRFHDRLMELDHWLIPDLMRTMLTAAKYTAFMGNEWNPEHPVEGAEQSIRYIQDLAEQGNVSVKERTMLWPFDLSTGKQYTMRMQSIYKIKK